MLCAGHWKFCFIPTPATPSSIYHITFIADFFACNKCQIMCFGRNKFIPNYYTYMNTYARAYICKYTATHLRTYVCFMKQPLIEVCFNHLNPRRYLGFRCLSHHMRAANAQTSLCIHAASPEPVLLSYRKQMDGCR